MRTVSWLELSNMCCLSNSMQILCLWNGANVDWWCGWTWMKEQHHRPVKFASVSGALFMGSLWIYLFIFSDVYVLPVAFPSAKPLPQKPLTPSQKRLPLLQSTLFSSIQKANVTWKFCSIRIEKVLRAGRRKRTPLQRDQAFHWGKN